MCGISLLALSSHQSEVRAHFQISKAEVDAIVKQASTS